MLCCECDFDSGTLDSEPLVELAEIARLTFKALSGGQAKLELMCPTHSAKRFRKADKQSHSMSCLGLDTWGSIPSVMENL